MPFGARPPGSGDAATEAPSSEAEVTRLQGALRTTEERLDVVARNAPDHILELDRGGLITYANRPLANMTAAQTVGVSIESLVGEAHRADFRRALASVFEAGATAAFESLGPVTGRHYLNRMTPVVREGAVESAILVAHDVTELKRTEAQLREREHWFRSLVDAAFDGVLFSCNQRIEYASETIARLVGYEPEELIGMGPSALVTPESLAVIEQRIETGDEQPYEIVAVCRDGSTFPCELMGRNVTFEGRPGRLTAFRDLTEERRREAERQAFEQKLLQAQKLESLGVLVGGIAHDFNNLLQAVQGNLELAAASVAAPQASVHLARAEAACRRAQGLTRQMLAYAGKAKLSMAPVDLGSVVREMVELVSAAIAKKTVLELDLAPSLPAVRADASQLRQVILNLVTNASEALAGEPGRVRVRTGHGPVERTELERALFDDGDGPGPYVWLEVADDGCGVRAESLATIFDPYFSTKFAGRGLGLSSVRGIMRAHRGLVLVESGRERGSVFRIYLPVAGPHVSAAVAAGTRTRSEAPLEGLVLLADDESRVRAMLRLALGQAGLAVEEASDGPAALELFRARPHAYSAVLLDLTMPGLGGVEVLGAMRALRPDVPVLLVSGYAEAASLPPLDAASTRFLAKPFSIDDLLANLRALTVGG